MSAYPVIQRALRAWVLNATGLADAAVFFGDQDGASPAPGKSVVLRIGGLKKVGTTDESRQSFDDSPEAEAARQEVVFTTFGQRTFTVELQAFSPKTITDDEDEQTARDLAEACQAALDLETVRELLNAAGLGVLQVGDVVILNARSELWEGRAILETEFSLQQSATDTTGYIASVGPITKTFTGG